MKLDITAEEITSLPTRLETDFAYVAFSQSALALNIAGLSNGQAALAGNWASVTITQ